MSAFGFIEAEKDRHPISVMCRMLGVSRSGYHAWRHRAPSDRQLTDAWLLELISKIRSDNRGVYGAPRVHAELRLAHGIGVGVRPPRLVNRAATGAYRLSTEPLPRGRKITYADLGAALLDAVDRKDLYRKVAFVAN